MEPKLSKRTLPLEVHNNYETLKQDFGISFLESLDQGNKNSQHEKCELLRKENEHKVSS